MKKKQKTPAETLGLLIREIREEAGVTQEALARHLGFGGGTVIVHIEDGTREMRLWEFIETCKFVDQEPTEVLDELMKRSPESHKWPTAAEANASGIKVRNRRIRKQQ